MGLDGLWLGWNGFPCNLFSCFLHSKLGCAGHAHILSLHLQISIPWLLELTLSIFHIHFSVPLVSPLGYPILLSQEKQAVLPFPSHTRWQHHSAHTRPTAWPGSYWGSLITIKAVVEDQSSTQVLEKHHNLIFFLNKAKEKQTWAFSKDNIR